MMECTKSKNYWETFYFMIALFFGLFLWGLTGHFVKSNQIFDIHI